MTRYFAVALLAVLLAIGSCASDKCKSRPAEVQIGVDTSQLSGVSQVDVSLFINGGTALTRRFAGASPTFVFEFGVLDQPPRALVVKATAFDASGRIVGKGEQSTVFSSDGCNFLRVVVTPGAQPDRGVDVQPDKQKVDSPKSDVAKPDAAKSDIAPCIHPAVVKNCTSGWCTIPAGCFLMGSSTTELCRESNEDQHQVTLTHSFEIASKEITQGEFQTAMSYNFSNFQACGGGCPVEKVNWYEAAAYCNKLSSGKSLAQCYVCTGSDATVTCSEASAYTGANVYDCPGYRLPTEAEWEYAYRAGTTTAFYNGASDPTKCASCSDATADVIAWNTCNSVNTTHPSGQTQANAWGLYDMAGNVWEWCHDLYQLQLGSGPATNPWGAASGSIRVVRGGSWSGFAAHVRAARRYDSWAPASRSYALGFRCVRSLP